MQQFKFTRQLTYGMRGEDVRLMQKLLNISNEQNQFYAGKIPEDGNFDMFRTRICLSKFQEWCQIDQTHSYNYETHRMLILSVNLAFKIQNKPSYQMYHQ